MSTPVNLVGRLTSDPELRFSANGTAVAKFSVVTSRRTKDQSGEWVDVDTSFWDCVAFKQTAENIAESLTKGTAVIVVGKAAQRTWETKEGEKRRSIEVTVDEIGPSLRFATAKVNKTQRQGGGDAPRGGQGGGFGQQAGGNQSPQGGNAPADDPWATGASAGTPQDKGNGGGGGGGGGFSERPPF
jgi:single-strand DNA-binding protein